MLNQFLEKFNEKLDVFKKFLDTNIAVVKLFFYAIALFILFIYLLDINFFYLNDFFSININKFENFLYLVLNGGVFYVFYILSLLKYTFIDFIFKSIIFFFFDDVTQTVYRFYLNLAYLFKYNDFSSLKVFNNSLISDNELLFSYFEFDYLKSKKFKKIILLNSNLPIFFYFSMLFILTTLFSLLFLSYLGLYGVFIINLISIILF